MAGILRAWAMAWTWRTVRLVRCATQVARTRKVGGLVAVFIAYSVYVKDASPILWPPPPQRAAQQPSLTLER